MINQPTPGMGRDVLKLTGGTMKGEIEMGGHKVTGLGTPTEDGDAANKKYVDDATGGIGATGWQHTSFTSSFKTFTIRYPVNGITGTISFSNYSAGRTSIHVGGVGKWAGDTLELYFPVTIANGTRSDVSAQYGDATLSLTFKNSLPAAPLIAYTSANGAMAFTSLNGVIQLHAGEAITLLGVSSAKYNA